MNFHQIQYQETNIDETLSSFARDQIYIVRIINNPYRWWIFQLVTSFLTIDLLTIGGLIDVGSHHSKKDSKKCLVCMLLMLQQLFSIFSAVFWVFESQPLRLMNLLEIGDLEHQTPGEHTTEPF